MTFRPAIDFPPVRLGASGLLPRDGTVLRLRPVAPALLLPDPDAGPEPSGGRRKIWMLAGMLHCSIIGTCLTTAELRQVLAKGGHAVTDASEHDLHREGVGAVARPGPVARLLNKALDNRHRLAIRRMDKAEDEDALRTLWAESVRAGEIPGAYWAVLTHPATSEALIRQVFGEVHMLSHLVGAANRADIRRLAELEAERAEMQARLQRQQDRLRDEIGRRDAAIAELRALVADRFAAEVPAGPPSESTQLGAVIGDLERRNAAAGRRVGTLEERLARATEALAEEQARRRAAERREAGLLAEIAAAEAGLAAPGSVEAALPDVAGRIFLYVGGRPDQIPHLRAAAARLGAELLHHDGGMEERGGLLAGLIGRAATVLFPVDHVSHAAAGAVKRLCRQMGKPFLPLRSTGLAAFLAALAGAV